MRASDRAYTALQQEILHWHLTPGTTLNETELAVRLGVSRTPLRAALARLTIEGLVDGSRGRTAVVSEVSAASIRQLFELREALETHAARLAAQRGDAEVFGQIAERFTTGVPQRGEDIAGYYALIAEFDEAVNAAVDNPVLRGALDGVRVHLTRARRIATDDLERLQRSAEEHHLICEMIRDGDGYAAAAATTVHLRAALRHILATLAKRAPHHQEDIRETPASPRLSEQ